MEMVGVGRTGRNTRDRECRSSVKLSLLEMSEAKAEISLTWLPKHDLNKAGTNIYVSVDGGSSGGLIPS